MVGAPLVAQACFQTALERRQMRRRHLGRLEHLQSLDFGGKFVDLLLSHGCRKLGHIQPVQAGAHLGHRGRQHPHSIRDRPDLFEQCANLC